MHDIDAIVTIGTTILKGAFSLAATVTIMGAVGLLGAMTIERFGAARSR